MTEKLATRLAELRAALSKKSDLQELAARWGAKYDTGAGEFHLSLFGRLVTVTFPDLVPADAQTGEPLPDALQTLLLYYLNTADGTPVEGRWVSFADLPDGRFYNRAFQGYTGDELAHHFCDGLTSLEQAARKLDGVKLAYGDAAFAFNVLPCVMLAVVYHLGDEDFPATCQILFDASASHYLPTDVCAVLGSMLTGNLLSE